MAEYIRQREEKEAGRRESCRTLKYMVGNKAEEYYVNSGMKELKTIDKQLE